MTPMEQEGYIWEYEEYDGPECDHAVCPGCDQRFDLLDMHDTGDGVWMCGACCRYRGIFVEQ